MDFRSSTDISNHLKNVLEVRPSSRRRKAEQDSEEPARRTKSRRQDTEAAADQVQSLPSDHDSGDADQEDNIDDEPEENEAVPHPIYSQGRMVYEDDLFKIYVKAVSHKRVTRYSLSDHLFNVWVEPKQTKTLDPPLLFDLEEALEKALIHILDRLKDVYNSPLNQNQIYITVVEENILNGLNSGNYSLNTPSDKIVRWVLSMLYNYLKSDQTLKLSDSFKIQIKVLSVQHTNDLVNHHRRFRRHVYH